MLSRLYPAAAWRSAGRAGPAGHRLTRTVATGAAALALAACGGLPSQHGAGAGHGADVTSASASAAASAPAAASAAAAAAGARADAGAGFSAAGRCAQVLR